MNIEAKKARLEHANHLIAVIGSHGRKFLRCKHTHDLAKFEIDRMGTIWYRDGYTGTFIQMKGDRTRWRGFSHGGTLQDLVSWMANYIETGKPLARDLIGLDRTFGTGNIWGYEDDALAACRAQAYELPIMEPEASAA